MRIICYWKLVVLNIEFNIVKTDGALLYVSERNGPNQRVQVLQASSGMPVRTIGVGRFIDACGICLSADGKLLFVADSGHHCVLVMSTTDGSHVYTIGGEDSGAARLQSPVAVCLVPDGRLLLVADRSSCQIQAYSTADGSPVRSLGSAHTLQAPSGVCVSPDGELCFVSDELNQCVQIFRLADGAHVRKYDRRVIPFGCPVALCTSPNGELLYVADCNMCRVHVIRISSSDNELVYTLFLGIQQFQAHGCICISQDGKHLFAADAYTQRVLVLSVDPERLL